MKSIALSVAELGLTHLLLATVFFASYAFAIGELVGSRARAAAVVVGVIAAAAFVALSGTWEPSVVMLALVPVATGLFACATWILCKLTVGTGRSPVAVAVESSPARIVLPEIAAALSQRLRGSLRSTRAAFAPGIWFGRRRSR